ncbi:hypothetical protein GCM10007094_18590 [Pseudovibrio japonicus]|uniref:Lipoprotein n=1 Tax=Pseudovibrio japonicus TaxID=366534 RepID=A0ABQ3E996_9HYPH|nr:hypothetical protein [Pseudovibrio japonicus]GHB30460.1 hypothetical protein GCM10007094_18590 [Pseudovibrio japonicus]
MLKLVLLPRVLIIAVAAILAGCSANPIPPSSIGDMIENKSAPPAVAPDRATFAFEQLTGLPGNIADDLFMELGDRTVAADLTLVRRVGAPATYRVKGFLTAAGDQYTTTVFYVFDIIDESGNRVHRIDGQEQTGGNAGDPWNSVTRDALRRIAGRTVASIKAWLYSS